MEYQRLPEDRNPRSQRLGKIWSKEEVPLVEKDQVREYLILKHMHRSVGPNRMHPQAWRKLPDALQNHSFDSI